MAINPDIERAYTPSVWSKKYSEGYEDFLQSAKLAVEEARSSIPCKIDVPYGTSERAKYDIYGTNLPNDAPVFIFIHGGYWQECCKEMAGFHIASIVSREIRVINMGYDLCPTVTLSGLVSNMKNATEEILKYCKKLGTKSVWIAGHSAGAHLAASLLYDYEWHTSMKQKQQFQLLKGIILIGGIYTLKPLVNTSFGTALKLTDQEIATLSYNHVDMSKAKPINDIKVIVTVGESDAPKFVDESRDYSKKLIEFVDRVEYLLLRNMIDHFDIVENLVNSNFILTKTIIDNILINHK